MIRQKYWHKLSNINQKKLTAVCSICGTVKIKQKQNGYRCKQSEMQWNVPGHKKPIAIDKEKRLKAQCGVCAICKKSIFGRSAVQDHCHKSNKLRGLLCATCNSGLGFFKDDVYILMAAIDYLRKW